MYTGYMCQMLQTPRVFYVLGEPKRLELPPAHVRKRCLGRMRNWIVLCNDILKSEFPAFETASAFGGFDLHGGPEKPRTAEQLEVIF